MPGLDGYEVCDRLRKHVAGAHVPVLIMTGLDDVDSINKAYGVGATDFITKPVHHLLLPHRLRYVLRSKLTSDSLRESEARLSAAQRLARLGHWEFDPATETIAWSDGFENIFGFPIENNRCGLDQFIRYVHPKDRKRVHHALESALRSKEGYRLEHRIICPDGTERIN